jgi:hypothetical protein
MSDYLVFWMRHNRMHLISPGENWWQRRRDKRMKRRR